MFLKCISLYKFLNLNRIWTYQAIWSRLGSAISVPTSQVRGHHTWFIIKDFLKRIAVLERVPFLSWYG